MTTKDRKFTPPTEFPAEYVDGDGDRVIIMGVSEDGEALIGYWPQSNHSSHWELDGHFYGDTNLALHDIPKRVRVYEVRYGEDHRNNANFTRLSDAKSYMGLQRGAWYITCYECDEDGGNPTITRIDPDTLTSG